MCNQETPPKPAAPATPVKVTKAIEKKDKKVIPAMKLTMQKQRKAAVKQEQKKESSQENSVQDMSDEEMDTINNIHFNLNVLKFKK